MFQKGDKVRISGLIGTYDIETCILVERNGLRVGDQFALLRDPTTPVGYVHKLLETHALWGLWYSGTGLSYVTDYSCIVKYTPPKFKVGDRVIRNGAKYVVTNVLDDGRLDIAETVNPKECTLC